MNCPIHKGKFAHIHTHPYPFYSVPVLHGILPLIYITHYALFVDAIWLLLQDTVSEGDLAKADHLLLEFCQKFAELYGLLMTISNKNFILKYFRCRDGKRTETRIGMEGICITHSCIPLYMQHIMAHSGGMYEWVIQIPSIPILVSVLFPSLHLKYFRIKFLLLVCIVFMRMRTKPHPHPVIS